MLYCTGQRILNPLIQKILWNNTGLKFKRTKTDELSSNISFFALKKNLILSYHLYFGGLVSQTKTKKKKKKNSETEMPQ